MVRTKDLAKGQLCQIRLSVCNGNKATTVLAHWRGPGITGIAQKANDLIGAWSCSNCHDAIDGRLKTEYTHEQLRRAHLIGIVNTLNEIGKCYETNTLKLKDKRKL